MLEFICCVKKNKPKNGHVSQKKSNSSITKFFDDLIPFKRNLQNYVFSYVASPFQQTRFVQSDTTSIQAGFTTMALLESARGPHLKVKILFKRLDFSSPKP